MKSTSKMIVAILLCLFLPVMGIGAGGQQGETGTAEPVKLTVAYHWTGTDSKAPVWEARIKEFQSAHPEIELELVVRGGDAHRHGVSQEFAAGNPPDVFVYWSDENYAGLFKRDGLLLDLTDFVKSDPDLKNRYNPSGLVKDSYQGRYYGIPLTSYYCFMYVNEKMLKKYALALPTTYDVFMSSMEKMKGQGVLPFTTLAAGGDIELLWSAILLKQAPISEIEDVVSGKTSFDNPDFVKTTNMFQDISGYLQPGLIAEDYEYPMLQYNNGETPMAYSASWMIGTVGGEVAESTVAMQFPKIAGSKADPKVIMGGHAMSLYASSQVGKDEDKEAAAKTFMKFMSDPVVYARLTEEAGSITAGLNIPYDKSKVNPIIGSLMKLTADLSPYAMFSALCDAVTCDEMKNLLDGIVVGSASIDDFVKGTNQSLIDNRQ